MNEITPEVLASSAGILVSFLLFTFDEFSSWFNSLTSGRKQLVSVTSVLVITTFIAVVSCTTNIQYVSCDQLSLYQLLKMAGIAILANTVTYQSGKHSVPSALSWFGSKIPTKS